MGPDPAVVGALIEEVMRKSAVCWLRYAGSDRDRPVWHVWRDGSAYVVSGEGEQPLPGIESVGEATVICRSKDSRERLLAWRAEVSQVRPTEPGYADLVAALVAERLNSGDPVTTRLSWWASRPVTRLTPTGKLDEDPEARPDSDHAAPPLPTPATTRTRLPRVLHRRQTRRPRLR